MEKPTKPKTANFFQLCCRKLHRKLHLLYIQFYIYFFYENFFHRAGQHLREYFYVLFQIEEKKKDKTKKRLIFDYGYNIAYIEDRSVVPFKLTPVKVNGQLPYYETDVLGGVSEYGDFSEEPNDDCGVEQFVGRVYPGNIGSK